MSCFPRRAWADPYDPAIFDGVAPPSRPSKPIVTIDRRVTHAGFVEVTSHV